MRPTLANTQKYFYGNLIKQLTEHAQDAYLYHGLWFMDHEGYPCIKVDAPREDLRPWAVLKFVANQEGVIRTQFHFEERVA